MEGCWLDHCVHVIVNLFLMSLNVCSAIILASFDSSRCNAVLACVSPLLPSFLRASNEPWCFVLPQARMKELEAAAGGSAATQPIKAPPPTPAVKKPADEPAAGNKIIFTRAIHVQKMVHCCFYVYVTTAWS